jgi:hypothetical protein
MSSRPCSLLDLPAEIRIGIYKSFVRTGFVKTHWSILGTSRGEVPVNLALRFRALKKIPTETLRACTQVKAEAKPLLYQGNKFFFETFTLLNVFCERIPSEKLSSLEKVSLYDVFSWMHFHNRLAILKNFLVACEHPFWDHFGWRMTCGSLQPFFLT